MSGTAFDDSFTRLVGVEGRYSNNPADSGGPTCWGITERLARVHGYVGAMRDLSLAVAKSIYRTEFWDALHLDTIASLHPRLAYELFDSAVNCSPRKAASWLQAALNGLNLERELYPDLLVDGSVGPATLAAMTALYVHRGGQAEVALRRLCDCQQGAFYLWLTHQREKDEAFLFGWAVNRLGGT